MTILAELQTKEDRTQLLSKTIEPFGERVRQLPDGAFPYENFKDLQKIGYPSLTIPKRMAEQVFHLMNYLPISSLSLRQTVQLHCLSAGIWGL